MFDMKFSDGSEDSSELEEFSHHEKMDIEWLQDGVENEESEAAPINNAEVAETNTKNKNHGEIQKGHRMVHGVSTTGVVATTAANGATDGADVVPPPVSNNTDQMSVMPNEHLTHVLLVALSLREKRL
jgi:hypothetical protein